MRKLLCVVFLLICGCVSPNYGNQNISMDLAQKTLLPGKTTKQEVLQILGKPSTVTVFATGQASPRPGTKEQLSYVRMTKEGLVNMSMTILAVFVDDKGTVLDYTVTESRQ